jgi:hypothetical protein
MPAAIRLELSTTPNVDLQPIADGQRLSTGRLQSDYRVFWGRLKGQAREKRLQ